MKTFFSIDGRTIEVGYHEGYRAVKLDMAWGHHCIISDLDPKTARRLGKHLIAYAEYAKKQ